LEGVLPVGSHVMAANPDFTAGRPNQAEHQADGGAFAGTVVAEQAEDFAASNLEVKILDRRPGAENFLNIAE
jgi:hypothetical protein